MSPLRIAFLLVFVAAAAAFFIARSAVASLSFAPQVAEAPLPTPGKATAAPRPSPRPTRPAPSPTSRPPTATPRPTAAPAPTATPVPATPVPATPARATSVPTRTRHQHNHASSHVAAHAPRAHATHIVHAAHRRQQARLAPTPRPTARPTPRPSPTALSGTTTLTNYWISRTAASRGTTLAVGYTIDNGTGRTERVMLGASIKPTSVLTWGRSISDPFHDVVATVPPGITTHVRYFTLADGLRPGRYDVAWGLRNAATGVPVALVSAPLSLRVTR